MKNSISDIVRFKFRSALDEYHLLDNSNGLLVGFSGGADSSALLRLLSDECRNRRIFLKAVHIHHGIRGAEADRDADFCGSVCASLGIDFELIKADIPSMAEKSGRGLEETARDFRYSEFARLIAADDRLDRVATAHNSDDNAETLLFNLIRGAGLSGLSGIPPIRRLGEYKVIRPLLSVTKAEILDYCREKSIDFIHDSTNDDTVYTRNFIRHELIPMIGRLNPAFSESARRLTKLARIDEEYLEAKAHELLDGTRTAESIASAHRAIASRAVVLMYKEISGAALEAVHIDSILSLCESGRGEISLPDRVTAGIRSGKLCFTRNKRELPDGFIFELQTGVNRFRLSDGTDFAVFLSKTTNFSDDEEKDNEKLKKIYNLSIRTELNSDTINHMLFVRSKRDGDSYVSGKMTRKLKKLFNDRGLDEHTRRALPILSDDEGILWVPGFQPADRAKGGDLSVIYYYNEV